MRVLGAEKGPRFRKRAGWSFGLEKGSSAGLVRGPRGDALGVVALEGSKARRLRLSLLDQLVGETAMKRQRGRGRKPGGHHQPNRSFESTGPDVKVRGNAATIYEKYLQLARDASSSGDRVMAESYLQHAEHYFRVMRAMQPAQPPPQVLDRFGQTYESDEDEDGGEDADAEVEAGSDMGEAPQPYQQREPREHRGDRGGDRGDRPRRFERDRDRDRDRDNREPREAREPRELREPREPRPEGAEGEERTGDDREFRRGRNRRGRYRPDGERDGPRAERGERPERPERSERAERPERAEREPVEGFGDGVPAFLAGE